MAKKTKELTKEKVLNKQTGSGTSKSKKSSQKLPTKKVVETKTNKKNLEVKSKVASKNNTSSKTKISSKKKISKVDNNLNFIEYYDLPYRYNQTIVKILAQTPSTLFVYWDISDEDRKNFSEEFGNDFFDTTYPVLIVHNKTYNSSFEIPINDFANSWYFNVENVKCDYVVELGRRSKGNEINLPNNYIYISSSNIVEAPNDHILFEKAQKTIYFRNVKNNEVSSKDVINLQLIHKIGRVYNIYDLYHKLYNEEAIAKLDNPTSKI